MTRQLWFVAGAFMCLLCSVAVSQAQVIEDFEDGDIIEYTNTGPIVPAFVTNAAAHDGVYGLEMHGNPTMGEWNEDWMYRDDAQVHNEQGDVISFWVKVFMMDIGRAYCGFGATAAGCYSMVLAPNTSEFMLYRDVGYGYATIIAIPFTWQPQWYRFECDWQAGGIMICTVYDEDGCTPLATMTGSDNTYQSGGIAFRYFGDNDSYHAYFDTIHLGAGPSAAEESTWGQLKSLFR